jgi:hypothetical protein
MLKIVIAIVLLMHGIGHVMGIFAAWTTVPMGFSANSWLFSSGVTISSPIGRAFSLLWLAAALVTVAAGWGLLTNQDWWRTLAIAGAILSLAVFIPWMSVAPTGSVIGAIAVDVLTLVALLGPWQEQVSRALR